MTAIVVVFGDGTRVKVCPCGREATSAAFLGDGTLVAYLCTPCTRRKP